MSYDPDHEKLKAALRAHAMRLPEDIAETLTSAAVVIDLETARRTAAERSLHEAAKKLGARK